MRKPSKRLIGPATSPFTAAISTGSAPDILRVRLLSMPQHRQAAAIARLPQSAVGSPRPDSTTAPTRIAIAPVETRLSTFSRNTTQAMAMVARLSRFSRSEAADAVVWLRPSIRNTGPRMPPNTTAPISQGRLPRSREASALRWLAVVLSIRNRESPIPEPIYKSPAKSQGSTLRSNCLENGTLAPNNTAETRANGTPGHWRRNLSIIQCLDAPEYHRVLHEQRVPKM